MNKDEENTKKYNTSNIIKKILLIIGIITFILAIIIKNTNYNISLALYIISYIFVSYEVIFNAVKKLFRKDMFDENFLMVVATIGAFAIKQYSEAIIVILLYRLGEALQDRAIDKSKKKISDAVDIRVNIAYLKNNDKIIEVLPNNLKINDVIVVKPGQRVPVDGILLSDNGKLDMSALTGESIPVSLNKNQEVLSGAINLSNLIEIKVTKTFENSTVSRIIKLIEESNEKKSNVEKFITRFSKIYTPIVIFVAFCIALSPIIFDFSFNDALYRAFTFLVISCPCALVISVPLGFFVGIGASSKKGILIKGSNYLDILSNIKNIVYDKTGTLTKGTFSVAKIKSYGNLSEDEILSIVAKCESMSNHYIAKSVVTYYNKEINTNDILSYKEIPGKGIEVKVKDKIIYIGNYTLMSQMKIDIEEVKEIGTIIYLAINNVCEGYLVLSDTIKDDAFTLIKDLEKIGIKRNIILTGDKLEIAKDIASKISITEVYANLLPEEKVEKLNKIKEKIGNEKIAYVGDGINDSPVLALADVGISMGKGSDLAVEASDVVIMSDEPSKILDLIKISRKTSTIVKENIIFAIFVKILFLVCSGFGYLSMWFAIFADVGVALLTIINSIRIFYIK